MQKIIPVIFLGVLVNFFYFPIEFTFLPTVNTKMMLAAIGLAYFTFDQLRHRAQSISKDLIFATILAILFSLSCYFSVSYFHTEDYVYAKYFLSYFVWLFGAYFVVHALRKHYGNADINIITFYLVGVCVIQCILSQVFDKVPAIDEFAGRIFIMQKEYLRGMDRLYGIGASLDSAGVRFSIALVLLAHQIIKYSSEDGKTSMLWILYIEFIFISIFGNMVARTTSVGMLLGMGYILLEAMKLRNLKVKGSSIKSAGIIIVVFAIATSVFISLYRTNMEMRESLRFAFEGFFNWAEMGTFHTDSTAKLNANMWIWPEDTQTWMIGTGKFSDWAFGTDIGYCRFILYCGLVGFSIFVLFFIHNAFSVFRRYKGTYMLSILLLVLSLAIWIKVSTDIFQIYAILYCADRALSDSVEKGGKEAESTVAMLASRIPERRKMSRGL